MLSGRQVGTAGGAALGTAVLPGIGTVVGGALGGVVGGLFDKEASAPQIATTSYGGGTGEAGKNLAASEANRVLTSGQQQAAAFGRSGANAIQRGQNLGGGAQEMAYQGQVGAAEGQDRALGLQNQGVMGANVAGFQANQDRAAQQSALGRLQGFYQQGPGPSAAEAQMRQGADANMAQAIALAHSGRGAGANANAMRQAAFQNAATGQQMNQQLGVLRANEAANWRQQQLGAMGMEQQTIGAMRGQSIGQQGQYQGFAGNMGQQGLGYGQLGLGYQQTGNQAQLGFEGQGNQTGLGYAGLQNNAGQFGEAMRNKIYDTQGQMIFNTQTANANLSAGQAANQQRRDAADQAFTGTVMGAGLNMMGQQAGAQAGGGNSGQPAPVASSYGGAYQGYYGQGGGTQQDAATRAGMAQDNPYAKSDVRAKENIRPADMRAVFGNGPDLRPAQGYSYDYKNQRDARPVGPMAQDLEKTPAGASTVATGPDGQKSIDTGRLSLVNAAAVSELQRRTDELEALLNNRARNAPGEQLPGPTQPASNIGFHQSGATGLEAMQAGPYGLPTQEQADNAALRRQAFGR